MSLKDRKVIGLKQNQSSTHRKLTPTNPRVMRITTETKQDKEQVTLRRRVPTLELRVQILELRAPTLRRRDKTLDLRFQKFLVRLLRLVLKSFQGFFLLNFTVGTCT